MRYLFNGLYRYQLKSNTKYEFISLTTKSYPFRCFDNSYVKSFCYALLRRRSDINEGYVAI